LQVESQKLEFKAESKVGSLANVKHKPGGGDVKIFDDKVYLKQISAGASSIASSEDGHVSGTQVMMTRKAC
jgi:microtubule-associated protein tau